MMSRSVLRELAWMAGAAALALAIVAGIWFAVLALWHLIVGAAVMVAAWRYVTRGTRRRRPKSSWSSLGRTAAIMYGAWNTRWLKAGAASGIRVPAAAGRGVTDDRGRLLNPAEADDEGQVPF